MDATYTLRPALPNHLPTIVHLDQTIFGPLGTAEAPEIIAARLAVFPAGFFVLEHTAERGGEFVGYGCSEKWLHERDPALDDNPHETHHANGRIFCITTIALLSELRGQGLGGMLLDALLAVARQHNCYKVLVETALAQNFYLRCGWQPVKTRVQRGVTLDVFSLQLG